MHNFLHIHRLIKRFPNYKHISRLPNSDTLPVSVSQWGKKLFSAETEKSCLRSIMLQVRLVDLSTCLLSEGHSQSVCLPGLFWQSWGLRWIFVYVNVPTDNGWKPACVNTWTPYQCFSFCNSLIYLMCNGKSHLRERVLECELTQLQYRRLYGLRTELHARNKCVGEQSDSCLTQLPKNKCHDSN